MQYLEALYVVEFGDVSGANYRNGGVAVLDSNRIFAGDSDYYCIGDFSVFGDHFEAHVWITKHNPLWLNVFGDDALEFEIGVWDKIGEGVIDAFMERTDRPGWRLPVRLIRTATLP
jgi:hypothetical protein